MAVPRTYRRFHPYDRPAVNHTGTRDCIMESIDVDGARLLDRKQRTKAVQPFLHESLLPFSCIAYLVSPISEDILPVLVPGQDIFLDIFFKKRAVVKGIKKIDVKAYCRVVIPGLFHQPSHAVQGILIVFPLYPHIPFKKSRIFRVVTIVLPSDQIDYLLKTGSESIYPFNGFQSLFASHVDSLAAIVPHLVGAKVFLIVLGLAEEQFGNIHFRVIVPRSYPPLERSLLEQEGVSRTFQLENICILDILIH